MQSKNKSRLLWLITGDILIIFSVAILSYALTDHECQASSVTCSTKRYSAYIGIVLSIIAFIMASIRPNKDNQLQKISKNNKHYGLLVFGQLLIIASIIMPIAVSSNSSLDSYLGVIMIILTTPTAFSGVIIAGLGIYNLIKWKKSIGISHPVIASIFVIGIVDMFFLAIM